MRKADYLRKEFVKLLKKYGEEARNKIYELPIPKNFRKAGDLPGLAAIPLSNEKGELIGIAVEHPYEYGEDIFAYTEAFRLR